VSEASQSNRARRAAIRETRVVLAKADALYAGFSCPASAECCLLSTTKRQPWLWRSEWELILDHLASEERSLPPPRADGGCPFLDSAGKRCTIYEARPLGCRTFFCHRVERPRREPVDEMQVLSRRLERINCGDETVESEPIQLLDWYAQAPSP
jgi:Fe-S-cluster containining protein